MNRSEHLEPPAWERFQSSLPDFAWPESVRQLAAAELKVQSSRIAALRQLQENGFADSQFLETVRRDLVPVCQSAQRDYAQGRFDRRMPEKLTQYIGRYLSLRLESWRALQRALEHRDAAQAELHERLMAESELMLLEVTPSAAAQHQRQEVKFFQTLDSATPRVWVVPVLVAANVLVFLLLLIRSQNFPTPAPDVMLRFGANTGSLTMNGEWWRLLAHMFLHWGILHIGFNMYVLWNVGQLGERLLGNPGFLAMYLISGVFGGIASLYWNPLVTSAGASGAVFGACGAVFGFVVLRRDSIPLGILKNLRGSLLVFFAFNFVFAAVVPGIDQAAHLGGLAAGLACGFVMSQSLYVNRRPRRWPRNLVCLAAAAALAPLAAYCLPPAPIPPQVVALRQAAAKIDGAQEKLLDKELSEAEFQKAMQTQVLKPLRRLRDESKMLRRQLWANKVLKQLDQYLELRIESAELLVEGVREWDAEKIKLHEQKEAAARQVWAN